MVFKLHLNVDYVELFEEIEVNNCYVNKKNFK
jgi:hypothetical protein